MQNATTRPSRLHDFLELTKPGITRMVTLTTAAGFALVPGPFDVIRFVHALIGTALVAAGAGALNQHFERTTDARMARTRERPLAAGRVTPRSALAFGLSLGTIGSVYLALFTTVAAALLAVASLASYWLVYTPLKPRTSISTIIGGIPGALPILIGWAATGATLGAAAWTLFAIMFLWQIPHFLALAFIYRDDYRRGGLAMLSVDDLDGRSTSLQAVLYALALLPVSLMPPAYGIGGLGYFLCALVLGLAFLGLALRMLQRRDLRSARHLFFGSLLYLPLVLATLVVDRWV